MKRGNSFSTSGPLTLGDLREIINFHYGAQTGGAYGQQHGDDRIVDVLETGNQLLLIVTEEHAHTPPTQEDTHG